MISPNRRVSVFVLLFLVSTVWVFAPENARGQHLQLSPSLKSRSLYSFGDSFVDPGNNNYIPTYAKSNFPPYGRNFPDRIATGRFSNGLLVPDFLAYYLGVKGYQRPYLGPNVDLEDSVTAVSFASATSGFDPRTANTTIAIQIVEQFNYFKKYKVKLQKKVGRKKAQEQIKKALFYVSAGSDDFSFTYFQGGRRALTPPEYEQFLVARIRSFLQGLVDQGARKIAVNGLPPLGCIPIVISLTPTNPPFAPRSQRKCLDYVNVIVKDFNDLLREALDQLQRKWPETKIAYIDFEEPLLQVIQNPDEYGFIEVNKGCCGTGLTEIGLRCNQTTPICADVSEYVFWDAAHPTEKTYEIIYKSNVDVIDKLIRS